VNLCKISCNIHIINMESLDRSWSCYIWSIYPHLYANDAQIYGFCRPGGTAELSGRLSDCVTDVASSMRFNRLWLNVTAKTKVLWCSSVRRWRQIPIAAPTTIIILFISQFKLYAKDTDNEK